MGYLQPRFSAHGRKMESVLPITIIVLNNHSEKYKGPRFDTQQCNFFMFKELSTTVLAFNNGDNFKVRHSSTYSIHFMLQRVLRETVIKC